MNLLKDKVPTLVRKLALPAMVGTLFQTFYNVVDTFFAGKISPEALSALSKSFPIYFIIVAYNFYRPQESAHIGLHDFVFQSFFRLSKSLRKIFGLSTCPNPW